MGGAGLLDDTPVLDIKPQVPYTDTMPEACFELAQEAQAVAFGPSAEQAVGAVHLKGRLMCWIPNLLTLSRLVLLLPVMWLSTVGTDPGTYWLAFGLFLVAALTDALDGWAARRLGCAGNLGLFLDPLADKVLANVLLIFLACRLPEWVPLWVVLLLVAREFVVQGFRSLAPCVGVVLRTGRLNKLKLVFQLIAIGAALAGRGWLDMAEILQWATWIGLGLALGSAYVSMYTLLRDNADLWHRPSVPLEVR